MDARNNNQPNIYNNTSMTGRYNGNGNPYGSEQSSIGFIKALCGAILSSVMLLLQFWLLATYLFVRALKFLFSADRKTQLAIGIVMIILFGITIIERRRPGCLEKSKKQEVRQFLGDDASSATSNLGSDASSATSNLGIDASNTTNRTEVTGATMEDIKGIQKQTSQLEFDYDGPSGVEHWGDQYAKCEGKYQSPINIDADMAQKTSLPPLQLIGFNDTPLWAELQNNGHTAEVTMKFNKVPHITGGPLDGNYEFKQFHFHWGNTDDEGSEDLINNQSFSMEIHMVLFKNKYETFKKALDYKDGISVLAAFFEVSDTPNIYFNELSCLLGRVVEKGEKVLYVSPPKLSDFLPNDLVHYYTYRGSLTTPPCNEAVIWIDFVHLIPISSKQLAQFRKLRDHDSKRIKHNNRPVHPLNGRIILYNMEEDEFRDDSKLCTS